MATKRSPKRRPRGNAPFHRRAGTKRRPAILIVCGGLETERRYFESLRRELKLSTVHVVVEGRGFDPKQLIEFALKRRDERVREAKRAERFGEQGMPEYDEVWCVFDFENVHAHSTFHEAISMARDHSIQPAVSNPAFEFWYLLHFTESSRPFNDASELLQALREHLPHYTKSADIFAHVYSQTDVAVQRATRLLERHPDDENTACPNPSTQVHRLVAKLRMMK